LNQRGRGMRIQVMMRKYMIFPVVILALGLALAACGSSSKSSNKSSNSTNASSTSSAADITIQNFSFTTKPVKAGATVTVVNKDSTEHTVTSDDGSSFNKSVPAGKTVTFTAPSKAGTVKFHCNIHTYMHGQLTVQ
jgi:plastocyanin